MSTRSTIYEIFSLETGHFFGAYQASSEAEAIACLAKDAGAEADPSVIEVREYSHCGVRGCAHPDCRRAEALLDYFTES